ncbi:MAG: GNAT family N-acetyltransferase [Streptococcus salivarius]
MAVYDKEELVAYIRLVGDGHSVIFVQDLLVRPDHQRQGIGTKLLEEALGTFPMSIKSSLQLIVAKNLAFYQSLGFVELSEQACTGMIYNN